MKGKIMQSGKILKLFVLLIMSIVILSESCGASSGSKAAKAENDKW